MKSYHLLIAFCCTLAMGLLLGACTSSETESPKTDVDQGPIAGMEETGGRGCYPDSIVPYALFSSWRDTFDMYYESLGFASAETLPGVRFGKKKMEALLNSCDSTTCKYIYFAFGSESAEDIVPGLVVYILGDECEKKQNHILWSISSDSNYNGKSINQDKASTYTSNWKQNYTFPEGYAPIEGYTYSRSNVQLLLDSLSEIHPGEPAIKASYAMHTNNLYPGYETDSLIMDVVLSDGGLHVAGDIRTFVDIARPCPVFCPID